MSDAATPAPMAQTVTRNAFAKVPRDRLVTLAVETDLCPQALLRVLGLITQQGLTPISIAAERHDDGQRIAVAIDALPDDRMSLLTARLEAIVTVRNATFAAAGGLSAVWG